MTHSLPFTFTARLAGHEREFDLELWFEAVPGLRATQTDPEAPERIELVDAVIRIGSTDHECPPWLWTMIEQSPVAQAAMAEAARREREDAQAERVGV